MVAAKMPKTSIADLEQQIAKVSAALEKARAQELAAAEKALAIAQKAVRSTDKKVADLIAKGIKTPAADARLKAAKQEATDQAKVLASIKSSLDQLKANRKSTTYIAKEVAKITKQNTPKKVTKGKPQRTATKAESDLRSSVNLAKDSVTSTNKKSANKSSSASAENVEAKTSTPRAASPKNKKSDSKASAMSPKESTLPLEPVETSMGNEKSTEPNPATSALEATSAAPVENKSISIEDNVEAPSENHERDTTDIESAP